VGEPGGDLDFVMEAGGAIERGTFRPEHLDGDVSPVPLVPRQVHHGHAAAAELALDRIAACQEQRDLQRFVGQGIRPSVGAPA
jgi:hypothetical protein